MRVTWLVDLVREDIRHHIENGVDLNPYSTYGSRRSWEDGFAGRARTLVVYEAAYCRGCIANELTNGERDVRSC